MFRILCWLGFHDFYPTKVRICRHKFRIILVHVDQCSRCSKHRYRITSI